MRTKQTVFFLLFLVITCTGLAACVEVGYRLFLLRYEWNVAHSSGSEDAPYFGFVTNSLTQYSPEFGYDYIPGASADTILVRNGVVIDKARTAVNRDGNIGDPSIAANWASAEERILVVGDSFTASANEGGIAWPDFLKPAMPCANKSVSILNLGREGYGVLQMIHLAAKKVETLKPTKIIVAIIIPDLIRGRFWHSFVDIGPTRYGVNLAKPGEGSSDPLNLTYFNQVAAVSQFQLGESVGTLVNDFAQVRYEKRRRQLFRLWTHSFVINRLRNGSAFAEMDNWNPHHTLASFQEDPQFAQDADVLNQVGVPIYLAILPRAEEWKADSYLIGSPMEPELLKSLHTLKTLRELPIQDGFRPAGLSERFFLVDGHPSKLGSQKYAEEIGRALCSLPK